MIPLEKEIENVSIVLQIKVINVDREQTYMKLETGQDGPMVSSSILVTGDVVEVLWGEYSLAKIKTKYIWIVPIKYDKQGKEVLSFSSIRSGSGLENDIEVGSESASVCNDCYLTFGFPNSRCAFVSFGIHGF